MTLITFEEIQILNAARRALKIIMERTENATRGTTGNVYEAGSWYRNRGRLIEQTHCAESSLFRTLNIANAYCDQDVPDWQMHMRHVPVEVYAEELVRLVNEELPKNLAGVKSWTDLHGIYDANEYLIAADEKFGLEFGSDEHNEFCNDAIKIAEKQLFGEEES